METLKYPEGFRFSKRNPELRLFEIAQLTRYEAWKIPSILYGFEIPKLVIPQVPDVNAEKECLRAVDFQIQTLEWSITQNLHTAPHEPVTWGNLLPFLQQSRYVEFMQRERIFPEFRVDKDFINQFQCFPNAQGYPAFIQLSAYFEGRLSRQKLITYPKSEHKNRSIEIHNSNLYYYGNRLLEVSNSKNQTTLVYYTDVDVKNVPINLFRRECLNAIVLEIYSEERLLYFRQNGTLPDGRIYQARRSPEKEASFLTIYLYDTDGELTETMMLEKNDHSKIPSVATRRVITHGKNIPKEFDGEEILSSSVPQVVAFMEQNA